MGFSQILTFLAVFCLLRYICIFYFHKILDLIPNLVYFKEKDFHILESHLLFFFLKIDFCKSDSKFMKMPFLKYSGKSFANQKNFMTHSIVQIFVKITVP